METTEQPETGQPEAALPGPPEGTEQAQPATAQPDTPQPDPTLASLLPRPERHERRAIIWALVGVFAIVLSLALAGPLHPMVWPVVSSPSGNEDTSTRDDGLIVQEQTIQIDTWPSATVVGIGNTPGLKLAGAWLRPTSERDDSAMEYDPAEPDLAELYRAPATAIPPSDLPVTMPAGRAYRLVLAWRVTDCSAITDDAILPIDIRNALGARVRATPDLDFGGGYAKAPDPMSVDTVCGAPDADANAGGITGDDGDSWSDDDGSGDGGDDGEDAS